MLAAATIVHQSRELNGVVVATGCEWSRRAEADARSVHGTHQQRP
jgi:hypothetical protein